MTDEQNFNMFQSSSKRLGRSKTEAVVPTAGMLSQKEIAELSSEELISRLKKMHESLDNKIESTCQEFGLDPKTIRTFLDNTNNFKVEEWKYIQGQRNQLLESINEGIGKGQQMRMSKQELEQKSKNRKNKTIGARRNWISM